MARASRSRTVRSSTPTADVAVIGGGLIGCAVAAELARGGARVVVLERGRPGDEASSAAAGMLGPRAECDTPGPLLTLGVASLALYPSWVARLREETGIDPEYQTDGILYVAFTPAEERQLGTRARWQRRAGFAVERVAAAAAYVLEPGLCRDVRSAVLFRDDHRLDNVRLTRAAVLAARRDGVEIRSGTTVRGLDVARGRVTGVDTTAGRIAAGAVVNAAGAWAAALAPPGRVLPVRPVRGQMVAFTLARPPFVHAIYSHTVYLVPRRDGRLLAGSTYEEAGFDKRVTGAAVAGIVARALRLAPLLADATFSTTWAGLRPGTPDGLPIIGRDPEVKGLLYATGHYRNGILLAPATARAVAALVLGRRTSYDLRPFAVERFAATPAGDQTP